MKPRRIRYDIGGQIGIWEQLSQLGVAAGDKVQGDQTSESDNYMGNWLTPTHVNVTEAIQKGDTNEILDNVFFGGLFGTSAGRQADDARKAQEAVKRQKLLTYSNLGNQRLMNYDTTGNQSEGSLYAKGGYLKPLNSDTVEVEGNTHAEGGVQIPEVGAEVEDKETISGDYVFSEDLGFAERHKPIAKQIGKIEKKPINIERKNSLEILRKKEEALKNEQELVRSLLPGSVGLDEMKYGGKLRKRAGGGPVGLSPEEEQSRILTKTFNPTSNLVDLDTNYIDRIGKPATSSINDDITTGNQTSGWGQAITSIAPYVTNLINSTRRLPAPPTPTLEQTISPDLISTDADKMELEREVRGMNKGIEQSTSNPSLVNSQRVANFGNLLTAKGKLSQFEKNTNAGIKNQTRYFNSSVSARNVERDNQYKNEQIARILAQSNFDASNLADATTKYQQQTRDNSMIDLENRKLDILPRLYEDTGVVNRNLLDLLNKEKRKYGGTIHIKPENRGKFNATKARTGKTTEELTHSSNPVTKKRAVFAQNAAKWKH